MVLLHERRRMPELMDDPQIAPQVHAPRASRPGADQLVESQRSHPLASDSSPASKQAALRDPSHARHRLGCRRSADRSWHKAASGGHALDVEGWDVHAGAVAYARENAHKRARTFGLFRETRLEDSGPDSYDVVTCSLFLHHLSRDQAVELLRRMASGPNAWCWSTICGARLADWLLAHVATRLLTSSEVVHTDGPRSVAAAFSVRGSFGCSPARQGWRRRRSRDDGRFVFC